MNGEGRTPSPEDPRVAAARRYVTDPVERELAEGRGVDLDVVIGLLAAYDETTPASTPSPSGAS